jgi:RNA polymerase sigma factor (sigma-70 family)
VTVDERDWLAGRFEENRAHLRSVAYRMLGSAAEADDAVQEAWFRLSRSDVDTVRNLPAWLTTIVARVSLDMLRSRQSRREELVGTRMPERVTGAADPEQQAVLADSVGVALLVVLDTLTPAERLAFVLHDLFAVPFEEIAPIVDRSPAAARQLASRARRRVRGAPTVPEADLARQREIVDAFVAASSGGDFDALLAVLDPDVVLRADATAASGSPLEIHGAQAVARGARAYSGYARSAQSALVNGSVGLVVAPQGQLRVVLTFSVLQGRIVEIGVLGDPGSLGVLELAVLDPS